MTIISMRNVPGKPDYRALLEPITYKRRGGLYDEIPIGFEWDGSSAEIISRSKSKTKRTIVWIVASPLNFCMRSIFPRHRHPIASCRHDWRCSKTKTAAERKWADREFEKDVGKTSWWITKKLGYFGVRIGAWFGVGVN